MVEMKLSKDDWELTRNELITQLHSIMVQRPVLEAGIRQCEEEIIFLETVAKAKLGHHARKKGG